MKEFLLSRIEKRLIIGFSYKAGRNFLGRKTIFTQGGGNFAKFFCIDYKRNLPFKFLLVNVYSDFNRNSLIGLICYEVGVFSNILLSGNHSSFKDLYNGFVNNSFFEEGNSTFLGNLKLGNKIHHIELKPGLGAKFVRSAGTKALLISKQAEWSLVKLPSGWLYRLSNFCIVVFGMMAKVDKFRFNAGHSRRIGFKPRVRGVVMNPCDHPHGGGEGKKPKPSVPQSPWGKNVKSPTKCNKARYALKKLYFKKIQKKKK